MRYSKPTKLLYITVFFIGMMFIPNVVIGQSSSEKFIDSILKSIPSKGSESEKKSSYELINSTLAKKSPEDAITLYKFSLSKDSTDLAIATLYKGYSYIYLSQNAVDKAVKLYTDIAWKYIELGNSEALNFTDTAIKIAKENNYTLGEVIALETKGLYYEIVPANLDMAGKLYFEAVNICEKHKLPYTANIYHTIGLMFHLADNYEKGLKYYLISYDLAVKNKDLGLQKKALINLGSINSSLKKYDKAEDYFFKSFELSVNPEFDFDTYANLGNLYIRKGDYKNAIPFLEKATEQHPDNGESEVNLRFLIDAKAALKDAKGMETVLERAKKSMQVNTDLREKSLMTMSISNYYRQMGDFENALQYRDDYLNIYNDIKENQRDEVVFELEAKYQNEKNKAELEKKERQKMLLIYIFIGVAFFLISLLIFYRKRLKYQKTIAKQREALQQKEIKELQQKNKLLALNSMIEGQEAERLRIAKDLHDGLGGLLSTVKGLFSIIQKDMLSNENASIYDKTNTLIDEACVEIRRISHNMMPHAIGLSGLEGALNDLGETLQREGIHTTIEISPIPKTLDDTKTVTIYRLSQELIANIRKHADAKNVLIQLLVHNNKITLTIEDDGKGFNLETAKEKDGLGIKSIFSRVEFLDGKIDFDTRENNGTTVTIQIPIT